VAAPLAGTVASGVVTVELVPVPPVGPEAWTLPGAVDVVVQGGRVVVVVEVVAVAFDLEVVVVVALVVVVVVLGAVVAVDEHAVVVVTDGFVVVVVPDPDPFEARLAVPLPEAPLASAC
jgi:hypothetical protein